MSGYELKKFKHTCPICKKTTESHFQPIEGLDLCSSCEEKKRKKDLEDYAKSLSSYEKLLDDYLGFEMETKWDEKEVFSVLGYSSLSFSEFKPFVSILDNLDTQLNFDSYTAKQKIKRKIIADIDKIEYIITATISSKYPSKDQIKRYDVKYTDEPGDLARIYCQVLYRIYQITLNMNTDLQYDGNKRINVSTEFTNEYVIYGGDYHLLQFEVKILRNS